MNRAPTLALACLALAACSAPLTFTPIASSTRKLGLTREFAEGANKR